MTVVSDFIQIVGDTVQSIPATAPGAVVPLPNFNTGGRVANQTALLTVGARNLAGSAQVVVNGTHVGTITATPGSSFVTQLVAVSGSQINDGANTLVLRNVSDAFELKTVICFFHQDA